MRIAITGHRPHKLNNEYDLNGPVSQALRREITRILDAERPEEIISGMALGVDTLFAELGLARGLKVIAAVPFLGQESRWPEASQRRYRAILDNPLVEQIVVCQGSYAAWKMQARNEWMVAHADKLICVWDGTPGGTANCVRYAQAQGVPILRINPRTLNTNHKEIL